MGISESSSSFFFLVLFFKKNIKLFDYSFSLYSLHPWYSFLENIYMVICGYVHNETLKAIITLALSYVKYAIKSNHVLPTIMHEHEREKVKKMK